MSKYGRGPGVGIQSWVTDYLATGMVPRRIDTDAEAKPSVLVLIGTLLDSSPVVSSRSRFKEAE